VRGSGRTQPDTTPDARSGFPPGSILASRFYEVTGTGERASGGPCDRSTDGP
jgi:hypothetical protein